MPLFSFSQIKENEKIEDWIFPKGINFKWYNIKSFEEESLNHSSLKISYYNISDNQIGTSEEIAFSEEESTPEYKLFEITFDEIKLVKLKTSSFSGIQSTEYSFDENNIFWKMPSQDGVTNWAYKEIGGSFYRCKSYWKIGEKNEKYLIVEKEFFEGDDAEFSREKEIEYFKKNKGLYKFELYKSRSNKLVELYSSQEGGLDPNIENNKFPLINNQNLLAHTSIKLDSTSVSKNEIKYPDGTIPKEYKIQILLDKGLPYLVKDTITVKNIRGIEVISPPKFIKSEHALYFEEKEVYIDGYVENAKIISVKYFKSPFSFRQELFYSDGEGNFKRVQNKKLYVDINYRLLYNKSSSDDFVVKEEVHKDTDLYRELSEILKKQGIYMIVRETNEENEKSIKTVYINFQQE